MCHPSIHPSLNRSAMPPPGFYQYTAILVWTGRQADGRYNLTVWYMVYGMVTSFMVWCGNLNEPSFKKGKPNSRKRRRVKWSESHPLSSFVF